MAEISDKVKRELLEKAAAWWDTRGSRLINRKFNTERKDRVSVSKAGPGIVVRGDETPVLSSGILMGLPWDSLKMDERAQVLEVYMHNFTEFKSPRLEARSQSIVIPRKETH